MAKRYTIRFTVIPRDGHCQFPIDMLRYDRCTPNTEEDSNRIEAAMDRNAPPVELRHTGALTKHWMPTDDRWVSFGWHIDYRSVTVGEE